MILDLIFTYLTIGGLLTLVITVVSSFPNTIKYKLSFKENIFTLFLWPLVLKAML